MAKVLVVYSTTDGHTRKICLCLQKIMEVNDNQATLVSVDAVGAVDLNRYDKIVVGASIRYGKHSKQIYDFVNRHSRILDSKPNAFFSVNVVARKPEKNKPETNPYLKKFLREISWKPKALGVFAGKINYQIYKPLDRFMIRFIMWITKGPTDPETNIEFTDWKQVEEFGEIISGM